MLQWADDGPGAGDVQHEVGPLVRRVGPTAGEGGPQRLPVPTAEAPVLRPGPAGKAASGRCFQSFEAAKSWSHI